MTFRCCEFVNVLDQGWCWIELWEATQCIRLWCVQRGEGKEGQEKKKKGGRTIMLGLEREDECSHQMQPLSLLNLTHRADGRTQQRGVDRRLKTNIWLMISQWGGRHGEQDRIIRACKSSSVQTRSFNLKLHSSCVVLPGSSPVRQLCHVQREGMRSHGMLINTAMSETRGVTPGLVHAQCQGSLVKTNQPPGGRITSSYPPAAEGTPAIVTPHACVFIRWFYSVCLRNFMTSLPIVIKLLQVLLPFKQTNNWREALLPRGIVSLVCSTTERQFSY